MNARFENVGTPDHELPLVSPVFYVRANSAAAFRSGQWAKVIKVAWLNRRGDQPERLVYVVEFIDGRRDLWPVYDDDRQYEFAWEPK